MAGTRTTIAEQFGRTAVGTAVPPEKRTVQPAVVGQVGAVEDQKAAGVEQTQDAAGQGAMTPVVHFVAPQTDNRAERLAICQSAILEADRWAQAETERISQQYLLMVGGAYELARTEELWREGGFDSFDAWGRALHGRSADYMNKVIRIRPVVSALASITRRQLQEYPLRPLVSVQRDHGDEAVRQCWKEAERAGNLTDRGFLHAAVKLGFKVRIEAEKRRSAPVIETAKLNITALRKLAGKDPAAALAACREVRRELDEVEAELAIKTQQDRPAASDD
ncbi:hypothetical protein [Streptomyces antimicrobicus]|uniref:Uncharacterized protein n=1 Tax=Streptomyces antimicrobicus TaxID=2883108 RepID=A0ABS8BA36_9ACTN|nr:hypothetical protein [Streptomyces antimicrobicus]MCB5181491.1 hypothetical protein [Streptomyces antimicrobicus]